MQGIAYSDFASQLANQSLFHGKDWLITPEPWQFSAKEKQIIKDIGQACRSFYLALETLYLKSKQGKSLLRNKAFYAPWVAAYLDKGKPGFFLEHAISKHLKESLPLIIRPDLLLTEEGFKLTELDAVPGGYGLTAFLYKQYHHPLSEVMIDAFSQAILSRAGKEDPFIAIAVSDEAATYAPEMQWLMSQIEKKHAVRMACVHPDQLYEKSGKIYFSGKEDAHQVDVVYRFFELFDWKSIKSLKHLMACEQRGTLAVTPPIRPFQEEKLSLALLHHPELKPFWQEHLKASFLNYLWQIVPKTWVMDFSLMPPCSFLHGPHIGGRPISTWYAISEGTKKERELVIKLSGFHELSWGSRSVTIGHDVSREQLQKAIGQAQDFSCDTFSVLQTFCKPKQVAHPVYDASGVVSEMKGRLRFCPYYVTYGDEVEYVGTLATLCPLDKKIIHGMSEAALMPCV